MASLSLKQHKGISLLKHHPWIFSNLLAQTAQKLTAVKQWISSQKTAIGLSGGPILRNPKLPFDCGRLTKPKPSTGSFFGILFTFTCSNLIDLQKFQQTLSEAALAMRKEVQILKVLGQAKDHPISLNFPEGSYLKGFICQVD